MAVYTDFYKLLDILKERGNKFDTKTLKLLPYAQLDLAAIGNAGVCRCSPNLVIKEKNNRRKPYSLLKEEDRAYLLKAGMLNDMLEEQAATGLPSWGSLGAVAQLWFKLDCLHTHLDSPEYRLTEVIALLQRSISSELLPSQVALSLKSEFQSLLLRKTKVPDALLRTSCEQCSNVVYGFIPPNEVIICDQGLLADYSCTASCFRAIHEY